MKYRDSALSCKATIYSIVTKLRSTASVLDKNKSWKRYVLTEEKLDDIRARLEASPKKPFRLLALQCRLAECTAHTGTKFLKLRSDETAIVVLPPDCEARVRYCMWFQESAFKGLFNPELTLYSDEAWYTLSGYVNSLNNRYWSTESHLCCSWSAIAWFKSWVLVCN
jgi:hypothetical protein